MRTYEQSRAAFFSLVRTYELAVEAGLPVSSLWDVLHEAIPPILTDIEGLEIDRYQKQALIEEVVDAVNALP